MSRKYTIFKPRDTERNFLLSVVFMTVRMLFFVVLLIGLSCTGLIVGVGKAWVDTTPDLDLDAIGAQAQTSFIRDSEGALITDSAARKTESTWKSTRFPTT